MKILLYTRRNVGLYCLSHLIAMGYEVKVMTDDKNVNWLAGVYGCDVIENGDWENMGKFHLFISIHGNKIVPKEYLAEGKMINLHPCLSMYPGSNPIKKYIENEKQIGSVTSHYMIEKVDEGKEIYSQYFHTGVVTKYQEFYDKALPFYYRVLNKTLEIFNKC